MYLLFKRVIIIYIRERINLWIVDFQLMEEEEKYSLKLLRFGSGMAH